MEAVRNLFNIALSDIKTMSFTDFLDIIIVAYLIYRVIWFVRKTNSNNIAKGIVFILIALWLSYIFNLTMINFLLRRTVELGLIALLILFQPELRRLLERMGRGFSSRRTVSSPVMEDAIAQVVLAATEMSASRTGALMIFERREKLNSIMSTGTIINSDVSAELIKNLFFNKAPLHDGAVVIRDGRIAAAGCVLPLTQSTNLSKDLGMRHRAGIGLSEQSDAVVIIVSEETGAISVAVEGMLKRHLNGSALDKLLHAELIRENEESSRTSQLLNSLKSLLKGNAHEEHKKNI
jgi:diadenylate cyclase